MINTSKAFNMDEYKEIALRRLYYILVPFIIIFIMSCAYASLMPSYYEAKTLIIASPNPIPRDFVKTTVPTLLSEQLHSIDQQIKSQTLLEQIINEFNMKPKSISSDTSMLVQSLRRNINVHVTQRRGGEESGGYFIITYTDKDPVTAAKVTNRLAELFIEDSMKTRRHQITGASEFMKDELDKTMKKLERQENLVSNFKIIHMGELPEQKDANIRMLEQLHQSYHRTGESLRAAQDRYLVLQKQITEMETEGTGDASLHELKSKYSELKSRYKPGHPDLKRMKKKIAELEANTESQIATSPRYVEMKGQIDSTNLEIARLKEEQARIKGQIDLYKGRIERTPEREQQLSSLTREYQNTKEFYDALQKKSQEASQAENLEKRNTEQFRIFDPATPNIPVKSRRNMVILMGLMLGTAAGIGLAFVREQMDSSFRDPEDVEISLGLRNIANIPHLEQAKLHL